MQPRQLLKVARELGPKVLINQAFYQFLLRSGLAKLLTQQAPRSAPICDLSNLSFEVDAINHLSAEGRSTILSVADRICQGEYRPYGADWQKLDFITSQYSQHWTFYERKFNLSKIEDIKDIWEPSRFSWAIWLANAYLITKNEKYSEYFWEKWQEWQLANPPYCGPNWTSSQEVAIRILSFSFVSWAFSDAHSSTVERKNALTQSIFQHAWRIPPTLSYAMAQRNNHILSEAAGLFTAGFLFSNSTVGKSWLSQGWKIFNTALQDQIDSHGVYIQHSVNYHRLMLQLAVWVDCLRRSSGYLWPQRSRVALNKATYWLADLVDPSNGATLNLGHNDGSDLFAMGNNSISDYRPVLQAAGRAFCDVSFFGNGDWDEFSTVFGLKTRPRIDPEVETQHKSPGIHRLGEGNNRGYIHIPRFSGRPAHADLLHVDLWKDWQPVTLDAGTYRYNAADPWQNSLTRTNCHNTIMVDSKDQMTRISRFLWVDKPNCRIIEQDATRILAEHDGYRSVGLLHQRALAWQRPNTWLITDALLPSGNKEHGSHTITLHWLVPLVPWQGSGSAIGLETSTGHVTIQVNCNLPSNFSAISAGNYLQGTGQNQPTLGWYSPTYSQKEPALSLCWIVESPVFPLTISTRFILDGNR